MQTQLFGDTTLAVTPIAFGAMRVTADPSGVSQVLLRALESGINFIDTARNYGQSEEIVGRTLREWTGTRPIIATKVKPRDISNWRFYVPLEEQFTPQSIRESVQTSLRTLGVDCVDYLQLHQWYYLWSHRAEWLQTFQELKAEGKIRAFGVSAQDHEHDAVLRLVDDMTVDGVQILLNAFESRPFVSVVPLAQQRRVGVIARCLFDHSGALAGNVNRQTLAHDVKLSNASPELVGEYLARIDRLRREVEAHGMNLVEASVRFALTRPGVSTLAISLATDEQIDQAIAAASKGPLTEELFQTIFREHVWVKNFYYFNRATVDGNRAP